jgi:hypothetical protein
MAHTHTHTTRTAQTHRARPPRCAVQLFLTVERRRRTVLQVGSLLGTPDALRSLSRLVAPLVARGVDDQDALHTAFLTRTQSGLQLHLDGEPRLLLSLAPCPLKPRYAHLFHCPTAPHDPMPLLRSHTPLLVHAVRAPSLSHSIHRHRHRHTRVTSTHRIVAFIQRTGAGSLRSRTFDLSD